MVTSYTKEGMARGGIDHQTSFADSTVYGEVRRGFEEFMRVNFHETGFLSRAQVESQRQFIDEAKFDAEKLQEARQAYVGTFASQNIEENLKMYYQDFIRPLDDAKERREISEKSHREWVKWIRDPDRSAPEKKQSIRSALPAYLKERRELAAKRAELLRDPRIHGVTDPALRDEIRFLKEDDKWFGDMEFTQRKNLIDRIRADLAVGESPKLKQLKKDAEKILLDATKVPQPAMHRDKVGTWLKRIFEEGPKKGASFEEMEKFIKDGALKNLITTWRNVAIKFWTFRKDPVFAGVKTEFIDTKAFLWKHYDERVSYVALMKSQRDRAAALRSRAYSLITGASKALDQGGAKRWLNEYVFNGNHTLQELESIINGNMATRLETKMAVYHRYEKAKTNATRHHGIRGMKIPEKSKFLKLHYDLQLANVEEMENRLLELDRNHPDFLLIRHEMDRRNFDEALELIEEGKKKALGEDDQKQLKSMEAYVKQHGKEKKNKVRKIEKEGSEAKEIDDLLNDLPADLQDIVIPLAEQGSAQIRMFGWGLHNRWWCNDRGYLNPERELMALHTGKSQAKQKVRRQKRKGVVSETIQGETGEQEYLELSRTSATNVCLDTTDAGAKSAMRETVNRTKNDHRAWYWTNIILHSSGAIMSLDRQEAEKQKIYKIGKFLASLEKRGQHYVHGETKVLLKGKAEAAGGGKEGDSGETAA